MDSGHSSADGRDTLHVPRAVAHCRGTFSTCDTYVHDEKRDSSKGVGSIREKDNGVLSCFDDLKLVPIEQIEAQPYALFCAEDRNGCHLEVYPRPDGTVCEEMR